MLTVKSTFKLFDVINKHFHDDNDSRVFISEIEEIMDNKVDLKMDDFATRKDIAELRVAAKQDYIELRSELKQDINELRVEFKHDMAEMKSELKHDMGKLRSEVKADIAELRSEVNQEINELRSEIKQEISELRLELKQDIADLRSDFNKLDASVNLNLANSAVILERTQKEHLKWTMGLMIALLTLAVAVIKLT